MQNINNILKFSLSLVSLVYSSNNIISIREQINDNKMKNLKEIVADGCNFTYQTYVKQLKKNNKKLSKMESKLALDKTISFIDDRYNYNIDIHKKKRLIEDRLLLIKYKNN